MALLSWLIFGALVGWIASLLMHRRGGLLRYIFIGILGSFLGGWLASLLGIGTLQKFTLEGFAIAIVGAVLLIAVLRRL